MPSKILVEYNNIFWKSQCVPEFIILSHNATGSRHILRTIEFSPDYQKFISIKTIIYKQYFFAKNYFAGAMFATAFFVT